MSLVINVNSDGCLSDFVDSMRKEAMRIGRKAAANYPQPETWRFKEWGDEEFFYTIMERGITEGRLHRLDRPINGAKEALVELVEAGHTVRIVTNKSGTNADTRKLSRLHFIEWFESHFPSVADQIDIIFVTGEKSQYQADVIIDDDPNTDQWAQRVGAHNLLFPHAYNRGGDRFGAYPTIQRIGEEGDAWPTILEYVQDLAESRD